MTREGAEKIKDALYLALSEISKQCRATVSCENCPLNNLRPGTDDFYECSFNTLVQAGGLDDSQ